MGRKIQAAKASLVAAFLAASGAAAQKAVAAPPSDPAAATASSVSWGDPLLRFIKLDGFPSFWKAQDFAELANFYKPQLTASVADLYFKYDAQVNDVLALYQKADQGPLGGIVTGLEQFWKQDDIEALARHPEGAGRDGRLHQVHELLQGDGAGVARGRRRARVLPEATGILGDPLRNTD